MLYFLVPIGVLVTALVVTLAWVVKAGLRRLGLRVGRPFGELSRPRRVLLLGCAAVSLAGFFTLAWGFSEPYFPVVERVEVRSGKVERPVRIVQVSDLHCDPQERAEDEVVALVEELDPDLIIFSGDGVNSDEGIPLFKKTMRALAEIAPLYGVRGNWESWWFTHVDTFADTGIEELEGEPVRVIVKGQVITLIGSAVDEEHKLKRGLRRLPQGPYTIAVHHYPAARGLVEGQADLLLSGDTHGGQIALPILGALVRIRRWDDTFYPQGLHKTPAGLVTYVARGIGMEGGNVPRVRLNRPPEVTLIELLPAAGKKSRHEAGLVVSASPVE